MAALLLPSLAHCGYTLASCSSTPQLPTGSSVPAAWKPKLKGRRQLTPNQRLLRAACIPCPIFGSNVRQIRRLVIQERADVNARDSEGRTPLHLALEHNQLKNAHALLVLGADVMVSDNSGKLTPYFLHSCGQPGFTFARLLMAYAVKGGNVIMIDDGSGDYLELNQAINQDNFKMIHLSELIYTSLHAPEPLVTSMYLDRLLNIMDRASLHRGELLECYLDPSGMEWLLKLGLKTFWDTAKKDLASCAGYAGVSAAHAAVRKMLDMCVALDKLRLDLVQLTRSHARFLHCAHCAKPARVKHCSKCMQAAYCSVACQAHAWPAHKSGCVAPREELD